jgi:hypothetical protein
MTHNLRNIHKFYSPFTLQNLMGMHPGGGGNVTEGNNKKSSKKAKFRTSSNSTSVLAPIHQEMETNPDLIPKHGKSMI